MREKVNIIDFHSHVLPGADHGSGNVKTSLAQLKMISESGTNEIVATSHYYPHVHTVSSYLNLRAKCFDRLVTAKKETAFGIQLMLGAEVLVCENLDRMKDLDKLCIEGTNTIFLEMPFLPITEDLVETVRNISKIGLDVVLAHIDRYSIDDILKLIKGTKIKAQLNTDSLKRLRARKKYISLIENGTIVALGSDIHGDEKGSYKHFARASELLEGDFDIIMKRTEEYTKNANKYLI